MCMVATRLRCRFSPGSRGVPAGAFNPAPLASIPETPAELARAPRARSSPRASNRRSGVSVPTPRAISALRWSRTRGRELGTASGCVVFGQWGWEQAQGWKPCGGPAVAALAHRGASESRRDARPPGHGGRAAAHYRSFLSLTTRHPSRRGDVRRRLSSSARSAPSDEPAPGAGLYDAVPDAGP